MSARQDAKQLFFPKKANHVDQHMDDTHGETLPNGFLDWRASSNKAAVHAGLQALTGDIFIVQ